MWCCPEEPTVSQESRRQTLEASALVHPNPEAVSAALFVAGDPFFFALDKVQVKYEMLRSHVVDGISVTDAAAAHGYSRGGFYLVTAAFAERGMAGLVDERRGRRGPLRLTDEIVDSCARHRPSPLGRRWWARSSAASVSRCTSAPWSGRGDEQGAVAGGRGGAV